jgi:hypothetical protein
VLRLIAVTTLTLVVVRCKTALIVFKPLTLNYHFCNLTLQLAALHFARAAYTVFVDAELDLSNQKRVAAGDFIIAAFTMGAFVVGLVGSVRVASSQVGAIALASVNHVLLTLHSSLV